MKKKPRSLIKKFVLRLFAALFCIIAVVFLVFGIKGYSMYRDAVTACPIPQMVSSIQSRENFVEYEELPTIYIDAVISVEDKRFESHCGVDFIAIGRAVWNDIKAMSFVEGGSTITQQIAKNQYYTQEKKLKRKFAEIYYADLNPVVGSEQGGTRPVLVISNDIGNKHSPTVIIAAITSRVRKKKKLPTHLYLGQIEGLPANSIILFEQLRTIDKSRLKEHLTHLDEQYLKSLEFPLLISIGVEKRRSL